MKHFNGIVQGRDQSGYYAHELGTFTILSGRTGPENQHGDSFTTFRVKVPRNTAPKHIDSALRCFFHHTCYCALDCQHVQRHAVTTRHDRRREWLVTVRNYRNI